MTFLRKSLSVFLTLALVFTELPVAAFAEEGYSPDLADETQIEAQAVNPAKVTEAVNKFTDALSKFYADTSKMSEVSSFLTRFGGLSSAASGVVGVLQMTGVLKDPTMQALGEILDAVHNMQTQLTQIDAKLDVIQKDLVNVAVSQQEISRNEKASDMLHYWNAFNTSYVEPLEDKMNEYPGLINGGIKQWWETSSHDGIRVVYTDINGSPALTYTKGTYAQGAPTKADNGEAVNADASFGVPAAFVPDTASITFDIDSYKSTFETAMADNFIKAANEGKLDATPAFYDTWNALSDADKATKAASYAADILNTQIYKISCDVMTSNDGWVISVLNAYRNYCDNILKQDSGVNAMLNAIYLTHGFEGEAKDDIKEFLGNMVVQAGYYGQFALTCAGQDGMQSLANRQTTQQQFCDTILNLSDKENHAITGFDNYCYITGTKVEYATVDVKSQIHYHTEGTAYRGYTSDDWKVDALPNMLDDVYAQVLYHQYAANPQGTSTFAEYLNTYKTGISTDHPFFMTRYIGGSTFALSEGVPLTASQPFGKYFKNYSTYRINVGNDSVIEDEYFHVHDKILADLFDLKSESLSVNQRMGARAFYGESHGRWVTDEPCIFWSSDMNSTSHTTRGDGGGGTWYDYTFVRTLPILKLTPVKDMNGDPNPNDPFFAFGSPSLTSGVSDVLGPIAEETRIAVTDLKLKAESFTYTGSAITPSVRVFAGDTELSPNDYEVTYINNVKTGRAMVRVTAKGNYSGMVSKTFEIVAASPAPKQNTPANASPAKKTAASKLAKTGDDLAGALALARILAVAGVIAIVSGTRRRNPKRSR